MRKLQGAVSGGLASCNRRATAGVEATGSLNGPAQRSLTL